MARHAGADGPEITYTVGENAAAEVGEAKVKAFFEAELGEASDGE